MPGFIAVYVCVKVRVHCCLYLLFFIAALFLVASLQFYGRELTLHLASEENGNNHKRNERC